MEGANISYGVIEGLFYGSYHQSCTLLIAQSRMEASQSSVQKKYIEPQLSAGSFGVVDHETCLTLGTQGIVKHPHAPHAKLHRVGATLHEASNTRSVVNA